MAVPDPTHGRFVGLECRLRLRTDEQTMKTAPVLPPTVQALTIQGLDHVVLRCVQPEATLAFYRDLLGCRVERVVEADKLWQLRAGDALIDLVAVGAALGGASVPRVEHFNVAHICLRIDPPDWPGLLACLKRQGLKPGTPQQRYGATGFGLSVYIDDPEGNRVELKAGAGRVEAPMISPRTDETSAND